MVAPRLTHATGADTVLVLDTVRAVEYGTHDELIAAGADTRGWAAWPDSR